MIRLSVLYPETDGASFDHDYYRDRHVPLCCDTWKPVEVTVDRGINGPYVAAVHFLFESQEALNAAFGADGTAAIGADVANYTTITPVSQVSEVAATY